MVALFFKFVYPINILIWFLFTLTPNALSQSNIVRAISLGIPSISLYFSKSFSILILTIIQFIPKILSFISMQLSHQQNRRMFQQNHKIHFKMIEIFIESKNVNKLSCFDHKSVSVVSFYRCLEDSKNLVKFELYGHFCLKLASIY